MKDEIERIIGICEKIRKISEISGDYPESVVKKLKEEFKLQLKESVSKIEIDFGFLSEELEKVEREIELIGKDIQDLENFLKGLEIRYLIGEIKESERDKKSNSVKKEIQKLKGKEGDLLKEKDRIEKIIKGGYEIAKEESKIFKVPFEEIPVPEKVSEKSIEEEAAILSEEKLEGESVEKFLKFEGDQEIKSESAFEIPSFTFGEEKREEVKAPEKIEEKEVAEPEKKLSEEKFEFAPMETIGYTPEKTEPEKQEISEEGKTTYVAVPYLVMKIPSGKKKFLLAEGKNVVGRSPDCQIIINEKGVSREHFAIHVKGQIFTIEDLGSKNGTFLNGKNIKSAELKNGDEIIAGECNMIFEFS